MSVIDERNLGAVYKPISAYTTNTNTTTTTTTTYVPPTYTTTYKPGFSQSYYTPASEVYIPPVKYYSNTVVLAGANNFYSGSGYVTSRGKVMYTSSEGTGALTGLICGVIFGSLALFLICLAFYSCYKDRNISKDDVLNSETYDND